MTTATSSTLTTTKPRERPIVMTGPEVRAILTGRQTQIRRPMRRNQPIRSGPIWDWFPGGKDAVFQATSDQPRFDMPSGWAASWCPFGKDGDRLWVRETWAKAGEVGDEDEYRADNPDPLGARWRSSTSMPRSYCRLILEVFGSGIQKLDSVTDAEAIAEGARHFPDLPLHDWHRDPATAPRWSMGEPETTGDCMETPALAFANYWNYRFGKGDGWPDHSAWVWAMTARRLEATNA